MEHGSWNSFFLQQAYEHNEEMHEISGGADELGLHASELDNNVTKKKCVSSEVCTSNFHVSKWAQICQSLNE